MLEELIIKNHILSCTFYSFEMIDVTELDVSEEIKSAYNTLLDYCVANDTLPSLVYYDDEFTKLASNYLSAVISALSGFEENKPLTKSQQDILRIGVVRYPEKNIIAYSPFHPINVAYQIALAKAANDMTIEIRDDILKKLCADNLCPWCVTMMVNCIVYWIKSILLNGHIIIKPMPRKTTVQEISCL